VIPLLLVAEDEEDEELTVATVERRDCCNKQDLMLQIHFI